MPHIGSRVVRRGAALVATSFALSLPLTAAAAQPWPPSTPPRVDLGNEPAPAPAQPPAVVPEAAPTPAPKPEAALPPTRTDVRIGDQSPGTETAPVIVRPVAPAPTGPLALYGSRDGQLYARTDRDGVVMMPTARFELDARAISTDEQNASGSSTKIGLARFELAGWLGPVAYFDASADFAHGPSLRHADNYLAIAPWADQAILQVGQFDAPFTLENRTPQRYLDFGDRGAAIGGFTIPRNKVEGAMVHGTDAAHNFYYSAGVFNGAGPGATTANGQVDVMARGWIAPFSFRDPEGLRDVTVGGSLWTGNRAFDAEGSSFDPQKTAAGYDVMDRTVWTMVGASRTLELRQDGRVDAVALELNAPFAHRFGARFEGIWKRQSLAIVDVGGERPSRAGALTQSGFATYLEVWGWVLGDDRLLGPPASPGLELPLRLRDFPPRSPGSGLMLAARVDFVDQDVKADSGATGLGVASLGNTKLTSMTLGASYWYSRRARLLLSYVLNHLDGSAPYVAGLDASIEHEILLRTALAL
jgi:hypothetical protein